MLRAADKWLAGYLRSALRRPRGVRGLRHLFFCVADHFEPLRGGLAAGAAQAAVRDWLRRYEAAFGGIRDADGRPPRHTFFTPGDEYDAGCLDLLAEFCRRGFGEVEMHLHHRRDTAETLERKLAEYRDLLHERHGLLGQDAAGRVRYGFVHGNWALCNSRPDGDWCGVNGELAVLNRTGCYADFTFPSAPSPTQPRMVNALYVARDAGGRPRGADRGEALAVGRAGSASRTVLSSPRGGEGQGEGTLPNVRPVPDDSLLILQGPLALDWHRRKWGLLPRLENAELSAVNPPTPERVDLWVRQWIHVRGRPDWVFVKVHTHGAVPANGTMLLGEAMGRAHAYLAARYNDGANWRLHYVTARELANLVMAAVQDGRALLPHAGRNAWIRAPSE